jgi:hypothetical protein
MKNLIDLDLGATSSIPPGWIGCEMPRKLGREVVENAFSLEKMVTRTAHQLSVNKGEHL